METFFHGNTHGNAHIHAYTYNIHQAAAEFSAVRIFYYKKRKRKRCVSDIECHNHEYRVLIIFDIAPIYEGHFAIVIYVSLAAPLHFSA